MPGSFEQIKKTMFTRCPFVHPTVIFHRDFFRYVGKYNTKYTMIEDLELWARAIVNNVSMKNINEPLLLFRISSNYWSRRSSWNKIFKEMKISIYIVKELKAYSKFHKIVIGKFLIRFVMKLMPSKVNHFLYNKLR